MKNGKTGVFGYALELLVVFIGVTSAFLLNTCRENLQLRKLETKFIESFKNDLDYDAGHIESIISFNRDKLAGIEMFFQNFEKDGFPVETATGVLADMLSNVRLTPKTLTYDLLKGSGTPNVVADFRIREEIAGYYQSVNEALFAESIYFEYINTYVFSFAFEAMDIRQGRIVSRNSIASVRFTNLVSGWHLLLEQNQKNYEALLVQCRGLRRSLEYL